MKMDTATSPADNSRHLDRRPRRRGRCRPAHEPLEARTLLSSLGLTVDNLDPGYVETGPYWTTGWGSYGFKGSYRENGVFGANTAASWTLSNLSAGRYAVYATYVNGAYNSSNAPFTVLDGTTTLGSLRLNEQAPANDDQAGGVGWESLGTYNFTSGTLSVRASTMGAGSGRVIADAIRCAVPLTPDLSWDAAPSMPSLVAAGSAFTPVRSYNVTGAAVGAPFSIAYYASTDGVLGDSDDVLLGRETIPASGGGLGSHAGAAPTLSISTPGTYRIFSKLDDGNAVAEFDETNNVASSTITVLPPLVITASASANAVEGRPVTLSATAAGGGGGAMSFAWDLAGNGTFSTRGQTVTTTFPDNGTYQVPVRATTSGGLTSIANVAVTVANAPPVVTGGGPYVLYSGTTVAFNASATDPGTADMAAGLTYTWNFGDGSPVATGLRLAAPTHVYPAPGAYTARITATDKDGGVGVTTALVLIGTTPGSLPSPTGRSPRLIWTPQQQSTYVQMWTSNNPWWQLIKRNADATGTPAQAYGDVGQWAMIAYQTTGDPTYAAKSYQALLPVLSSTDANTIRQEFEDVAVRYDWLYPALNAAQKATIYNALNYWGDIALGRVAVPGWWLTGARTSDSDQTTAEYFGLAMIDLATGPDNPRAGTFLNATFQDIDHNSTQSPVGGLDSTGVNRDTLRNTLSDYASEAAGGTWIESSDYDMNTLKLVIEGVSAIDTATGVDHFPELTQVLKQAALEQVYEVTSDLNQAVQWGDEEWARNLKLFDRVPTLAMLGGLFQNDPQVGPYANELVQQLVSKYGYTGYNSAEPIASGAWMFELYNPQAPTAPLSGLADGHYSPGMGILQYHDGWTQDSSLFEAQMATHVDVDHEVADFGDFQLYRDGEWAVTHPLGYGTTADSGASTNSMLIDGLSSMAATRGPVAQESATDGSFAYLAGTTGGQYYAQPYYQPPPTFLQEWTRSLFYLPSADGHSDTILVFDRVNASDPRTMADFSHYRASDQALMTAAPAVDQWIMNMPVQPSVTGSGFSWQTAGGQDLSVNTLLPLNQTRSVINDQQTFAGLQDFTPSEAQGWQVRVSPVGAQNWNTFLNVVQASDAGASSSTSLVQSDGGEAQGSLIRRSGSPDALVMFGAESQARVLNTGYSAHWTGGTATSTVYLLDLNPAKTWSVWVDGKPAAPLSVDSQGLAHLTVSGVGAHSIQIRTSAELGASGSAPGSSSLFLANPADETAPPPSDQAPYTSASSSSTAGPQGTPTGPLVLALGRFKPTTAVARSERHPAHRGWVNDAPPKHAVAEQAIHPHHPSGGSPASMKVAIKGRWSESTSRPTRH